MSNTQGERALSLDALRGLAIGLMCLSGIVPRLLPNWMYHGYTPQRVPDAQGLWQEVQNPWAFRAGWASMTWVDWVFPMFLFAMGAAIPLAMHGRLSRGISAAALLPGVVIRCVVLLLFAVFVQQVSPYQIENPPSASAWVLGLVGFVVLFAVFVRLPRETPASLLRGVRIGGVLTAVLLVVYVNTCDGERAFAWSRNDIIIVLLAWSSLAASVLWLMTRRRPGLRLAVGLLIGWVAHYGGMKTEWRFPANEGFFGGVLNTLISWLQWPGSLLDMRWLARVLPGSIPEGVLHMSVLYDFTWLKYLWVVVPGTVIGDLLTQRMQRSDTPMSNPEATRWGTARLAAIVVLSVLVITAVLAGLKDYVTVWATLGSVRLTSPGVAALLAVPLLMAMLLLVWPRATGDAQRVRTLVIHGVVWTTAGLLLGMLPGFAGVTPTGFFENGISKGPPATLSWYCVSVGLSVLLLAALFVWIDVCGGRRSMGLLIGSGQNPMLAYVGIRNLLAPLVSLPVLGWLVSEPGEPGRASLNGWYAALVSDMVGAGASPWWDAGWAVVKTLMLLCVTWAMTARRMVWRA